MDKKYFLQIEIRYSIPENEDLPEDAYQQIYFKKYIHSNLFDTEKDCIKYGNEIIQENRWIEQFPGYKGLKLGRRFGDPLVGCRLKNGAQIFIQVKSILIHSFTKANTELQKFNIDNIYDKI